MTQLYPPDMCPTAIQSLSKRTNVSHTACRTVSAKASSSVHVKCSTLRCGPAGQLTSPSRPLADTPLCPERLGAFAGRNAFNRRTKLAATYCAASDPECPSQTMYSILAGWVAMDSGCM